MIVHLQNVTKSYSGMPVLLDINLNVEQRKIICVLGPSGAGKSTLLNILAQTLPADGGNMTVHPDLKVSYVFQEDCLLPWCTVGENIAFVQKETEPNLISTLLHEVGLGSYQNHYPDQLSGGMRQRCSIARAFHYGGNLLLMDEPFHSLDYHLRFELVQKLIALWERSGCAIVMVTHDIDEALLLGNEIVILSAKSHTIAQRIALDSPQGERSLKDLDLMKVRAEILEQLCSV
ncbi:ABC transporter ATP-binding protein [Paenibacillus sanguinis]|uniref:ABC transporter ATP-binding protein n=1 Tax=Paenibacillus sanguinis TaxID=225906 RepID=UPI00037A0A4A|nr:ABC transporter ATP-binding protein [Paenibacillus sanguinis]